MLIPNGDCAFKNPHLVMHGSTPRALCTASSSALKNRSSRSVIEWSARERYPELTGGFRHEPLDFRAEGRMVVQQEAQHHFGVNQIKLLGRNRGRFSP